MAPRNDPTHLKLVKGITRKDRLPVDEPQVDPGIPPMPGLSGPHAVDAWGMFSKILNDMGVLTPADGAALQRLAECYAQVQALTWTLADAGSPTYLSGVEYGSDGVALPGTGIWKPRPECALLSDADRRLKTYITEFGLTPSARARVRVERGGKKKAAKPEDRFFG